MYRQVADDDISALRSAYGRTDACPGTNRTGRASVCGQHVRRAIAFYRHGRSIGYGDTGVITGRYRIAFPITCIVGVPPVMLIAGPSLTLMLAPF